MTVSIERRGDTAFVIISGDIDANTSVEIKHEVNPLLSDKTVKNIIVDMDGSSAINSFGIGKLLQLFKHADSRGGEFKIIGLCDHLFQMFTEYHMNELFPIEKSNQPLV
jgi:anti-anti-sigma factor